MKSQLTTPLLLIGVLSLLSFVGPALDAESQEHEVASEERPKHQRQERFEKAAREICGENSSWALTSGKNEIVCKTKRGHKTGKVAAL